MAKAVMFTMKLEAELRADFMAEAEASHRPASQVVRELMREFVQRQRDSREQAAFIQHKVDVARGSVQDGHGRSNDHVEADFAARRARIAARQ